MFASSIIVTPKMAAQCKQALLLSVYSSARLFIVYFTLVLDAAMSLNGPFFVI